MFETLKTAFADWLFYRETVERLSRLDNHLLADMGLRRRDIAGHARRAVYGERWRG